MNCIVSTMKNNKFDMLLIRNDAENNAIHIIKANLNKTLSNRN